MSECRTCCAVDVAVPGDLDGGFTVYSTQVYSFVITTCPTGVVCPPGLLPRTVTVPNVPPVIVPPNPRVLSLQGCKSLITATVPTGASASVISGIAAGMQQQWAAQQAQCNLVKQFQLQPQPTIILLPTIAVNSACPGSSFNQTLPGFTGVNPTEPVSIFSGSLPPGLSFTAPTASTGLILSGTPSTPGNYSFTFQGVDSSGRTVQQPYTMAIVGITNLSSLPTATENTAYSFQLVAAGGVGPYTFTLQTGSLNGLSLSGSGLISGTPAYATAGAYDFAILVTDVNGNTCVNSGTLNVILRPGPDWTLLTWPFYGVVQNPPNFTGSGSASKNSGNGTFQNTQIGFLGKISPAGSSVLTYTGPSVTARCRVVISAASGNTTIAIAIWINGVGGTLINLSNQAPGTYTNDVVIPLSAGTTLQIQGLINDNGPNDNSLSFLGGIGSFAFTFVIFNV